MKANKAFERVCNLISEKYLDNGWKYSKSGHWMSKKDKNFIYKVFFYTSWNNISDKNVVFYGECAILPLKSKDKIFHINTRQCNVPSNQLYWNIANEEEWERTVNEFTNWLNSVFMPIVERCHTVTAKLTNTCYLKTFELKALDCQLKETSAFLRFRIEIGRHIIIL